MLASPDFKPGFISLTRMRCKQWDCPFCCIKNGDMWRAHLLHTLCETMPDLRWVFVTLTAPSWSHHDPKKSLIALKKAWGKMYDKLRYKNGGTLTYVMLYETHKSGAFHVHALCAMGAVYDEMGEGFNWDGPYDTIVDAEKAHPFGKWLKEKAVASKAGWVCHARRIQEGDTGGDNQRLAVGYITKYITKGAGELVMPPRWRRIGTSRDIGSPKTKSKKEFKWAVRQSVHYKETDMIPHWVISENRPLDASDFGDSGFYPEPPENA